MVYGSLGGLGGWRPYPVRQDPPESSQVMSGEEITNSWNDRLADIPQNISSTTVETVPWEFQKLGGQYNNMRFEKTADYGYAKDNGINMLRYDINPFRMVVDKTTTTSYRNPEYDRVAGLRDDALAQFGENNIRQQQAYDGMQGQYSKNGIMPEGYSAPNFGQISGQENTGVTNTPGIGMDWTAGVYDQNFANGLYGNNGAAQNGATRWL